MLGQFRAKRDYRALHGALQSATPTPEVLYLRAELYRRCSRAEGKTATDAARERSEERQRFANGLVQGGGNSAQRLEAYDKLNVDLCAGLDLGTFSEETLQRMVADAANAGDPRAQAWQLAERIERTRFAGSNDAMGYDISDQEFEQMRRLMATRDPEVILDLQGVLSSCLQHGSVRFNGEPVDQENFFAALTLLACDAGADCGPESQTILMNCAYRGRCLAGTVSDYMYFYQTSPAGAQQIDTYLRAWQAMLNAGDLSA